MCWPATALQLRVGMAEWSRAQGVCQGSDLFLAGLPSSGVDANKIHPGGYKQEHSPLGKHL